MKFEKDFFFLLLRIFIIGLFLFFICFLGEKVLERLIKDVYTFKYVRGSSFIFLFFITLYFLTFSAEILNKKLILRNIFGIKINTLDLNTNYKRKIIERAVVNKGEVLWTMFGKKYKSTTHISFKSSNKKIRINGHIFSKEGLSYFIKKTKK